MTNSKINFPHLILENPEKRTFLHVPTALFIRPLILISTGGKMNKSLPQITREKTPTTIRNFLPIVSIYLESTVSATSEHRRAHGTETCNHSSVHIDAAE